MAKSVMLIFEFEVLDFFDEKFEEEGLLVEVCVVSFRSMC